MAINEAILTRNETLLTRRLWASDLRRLFKTEETGAIALPMEDHLRLPEAQTTLTRAGGLW
ncbi:hypothetical protein FRC19_011007 [Serendipita sp. 401]|nr:hypothetical protein FRC19_011007 [Serendipita sp. 401]